MIHKIDLENAVETIQRDEPVVKAFTYLPDNYSWNTSANTLLSGVTVAVKDLVNTAGMPTTYGSKAYEGYIPVKDAWIVQRLKELGAIIMGKTVTTEFAWRDAGPTTNPWNSLHTPGGSSSGSGAAVGAGMADMALGTQTIGSVIRPAAYCGCVGYKPTYGSISREGVHPLSDTLDHVGFLTSSCYWAAVAYALIIENQDGKTLLADFEKGKKPLKVGLYRSSQWHTVQADVKANFDSVMKRLADFGIEFVDIELDLDITEVNRQAISIMAYEANRDIYPEVSEKTDKIGQNILELMSDGQKISADEYQLLLTVNRTMRDKRDDLFKNIDVVMSIASPTDAPVGLAYTGNATFCAPWTYLGLPAVTIPAGISQSLLPLGLQLIGKSKDDLNVLKMAQWVANHLPKISRPMVSGY